MYITKQLKTFEFKTQLTTNVHKPLPFIFCFYYGNILQLILSPSNWKTYADIDHMHPNQWYSLSHYTQLCQTDLDLWRSENIQCPCQISENPSNYIPVIFLVQPCTCWSKNSINQIKRDHIIVYIRWPKTLVYGTISIYSFFALTSINLLNLNWELVGVTTTFDPSILKFFSIYHNYFSCDNFNIPFSLSQIISIPKIQIPFLKPFFTSFLFKLFSALNLIMSLAAANISSIYNNINTR